MGRPRKPITAKILEGTFRLDRDGVPSLANTGQGEPTPPAHLDGVALDFWHAIVPDLIRRGVVAASDSSTLAMLCEWWARYRKFSDALDNAAPEKSYQLMLQVGIATTNFDRLASRFGLTPSDRAKLRTDPSTQPSRVSTRKRG